jgi:GT2 family glycosyltransferase
MNFGVVIATYNRIDLLRECIDCVLAQTVQLIKVIIVNNGSTDDTKNYLNKLMIDSEELFKGYNLDENIGGAGGFYYALEKIKSEDVDWILIIDDDALIEPNYIELIRDKIQSLNSMAFSGTVTTNGKIDLLHRKIVKNKSIMKFQSVEGKKYLQDVFEYDLSSFCGLVIKKDILKLVGLPNVDYYQWYVDTEYSLRIKEFSKIINVNNAKLNHKVTYSSKKDLINWKKSYYGYRNLIYMGWKYSNKPILFSLYIYTKHLLQLVYCLGNFIIAKEKELWRFRLRLHFDVIIDTIKKKTGENPNYPL